jgi:hypothetical protein
MQISKDAFNHSNRETADMMNMEIQFQSEIWFYVARNTKQWPHGVTILKGTSFQKSLCAKHHTGTEKDVAVKDKN